MEKKKMSLMALVLMIFTSVFGFSNCTRAFYLMGYSAIPWYILSAITFFLPYAFMMAEFGTAYKNEKGIYAWMANTVSPKFAFVGIFMWYASYVVWMVSVSSSIWVPLSNLIAGDNVTSNWSIFGLTAPQTLALLGSCFIVVVTFLSSRGMKNVSRVATIGGTFCMIANVVLIAGSVIVFIGNHGIPRETMAHGAFFHSPNLAYASPLAMCAFLVYAIIAYGGLEAVGGLVDQTENPEKNFPKGIKLSAIIIAVGYSLCILLVGLACNWTRTFSSDSVNISSVVYACMKEMGVQIGGVFGMSAAAGVTLGAWFARFTGLAMFLSLMGAFFTLIYAPLRQLIEGTPKEIWPESWTKENKYGMPGKALWVQACCVIVIIIVSSFGGKTAAKFYMYLTLMCNVAMTIPTCFLSLAYIKFRKNQSIEKPFLIIKSERGAMIAGIAAFATVGFANVFTIFQPIIQFDPKVGPDWMSTIYQILGPVVFTAIALLLFRNYEKKSGKGNKEEVAK